MGKTRSNDIISKQDLELKRVEADSVVAGGINIYEEYLESVNNENNYIFVGEYDMEIVGDIISLGSGAGMAYMNCGLRIYNVGSLADYVRTAPLAIGTMIYSLEEAKPLWLAQTGKTSLTSITISSVSGVSGNVSVELEKETITFTMTEGDTVADVIEKMRTAINAGTYYTAQVIGGRVNVESKNYVMETSTPTLTCDDGVVVDANITLNRAGQPFTFVDGAGTQVEVE